MIHNPITFHIPNPNLNNLQIMLTPKSHQLIIPINIEIT